MEDKINKGKEFVVDKLQMPREVVFDIPRIVITGNEEITIEHHKGIITFDKENIRVNSKIGPVKISGKDFEILFIGATSITVSGKFKSVEYEGVHHE